MFTQDIFIDKAGWSVRVYHDADALCADEIIDDLITLGCRGEDLRKTKRMLWDGMVDSGVTFSDTRRRKSIIVIGNTTSGREYWNSIDHEKNHLLQDISLAIGIDPYGEEISYISGEFIRSVYDEAKNLLCECCRKRVSLKSTRKPYKHLI